MSRWAIDPNLRYWKRGKREGGQYIIGAGTKIHVT